MNIWRSKNRRGGRVRNSGAAPANISRYNTYIIVFKIMYIYIRVGSYSRLNTEAIVQTKYVIFEVKQRNKSA